jgi:mono/diheme cytochrome c family protein
MRATLAGLLLLGLGAQSAALRTNWDGVYSDEQAARGEKLYAEKCSSCHGRQLGGNDAPPLTGPDFFANWNKQTVGDLFDKILKTMPQDDPNLNAQQTSDLIAAIFKHEETPPGKSELSPEVAALKNITILSVRPDK